MNLLDELVKSLSPKPAPQLYVVSPSGILVRPELTMLSAADMATTLLPIPWVCPRLKMVAGAVTIIGGAGFGGKTIAMQAMLLAVAAGLPTWGEFPTTTGRMVHVDYEQGRYLTQDRYQRLARAMGVSWAEIEARKAVGVCCLPDLRLCSEQAQDALMRAVDGATIALVDSFRAAFPSAKENDSDARRYLDMISRVSDKTRCAIVVIAHSKKAGDEKVANIRSSLRGTGALFDAAQCTYMLDGSPGKPTQVHHVKERMRGKLVDMFGLRVVDVPHDHPHPSHATDCIGDNCPVCEWGLRVEYVPGDVVAAAYEDDGSDISANVARIESLGIRVLALLSHGEILTKSQIATYVGCSMTILTPTLTTLIQGGALRCEGTGPNATYCVPRSSGED
jgi:hypothetical protein